jgi:hypothetical protein
MSTAGTVVSVLLVSAMIVLGLFCILRPRRAFRCVVASQRLTWYCYTLGQTQLIPKAAQDYLERASEYPEQFSAQMLLIGVIGFVALFVGCAGLALFVHTLL